MSRPSRRAFRWTAPGIGAILGVVLASAALTGCISGGGGGASPSSALPPCLATGQPMVLAIGARSNNPQPNMSQSLLALMNSTVNANQKLTIIRLDGQPQVLFSEAYKPTGGNSQSRKAAYNTYVGTVNAILYNTSSQVPDIKAQVAQANVLQALTDAADDAPPGGDVIVMDSGLQTTNPLNFADGLLGDSPQTIVSALRAAGELPNLKGRRVGFTGLGWTASPQPPLGTKYQAKVAQIWEDIATAAGASCVWSDSTANTSPELAGLPGVTVVKPPPVPPVPGACSETDLGESDNVGFIVDSTTFVDPAGARATLQKLATTMLKTGEVVTLTGSTSSEGSAQHNQVLSLQRANAVRDVLVQLGVPASHIMTFGDGSRLPGRLNDIGPNGQLLIGPAIKNRKVVAKLSGSGCPA